MIRMARNRVEEQAYPASSHPHLGLVLDRCLQEWPENSTDKGEYFAKFIDQACKRPVSPAYLKAYNRWFDLMVKRAGDKRAALWCGKVDGRLFLGTGGVSPLEAAVTLHHTYGVPLLPGSALKGLAHGYARERLPNDHNDVLFGRGPTGEGEVWDGGEAGYLIFHDAWWIPKGMPLIPEVVTVHHTEYYRTQGGQEPADFDSPTPNAQVAIQGSFLFAIEGDDGWTNYGIRLLQDALKNWGAGAKTAAGYGYFLEDDQKPLNEAINRVGRALLSGEALLRAKLADWNRNNHQVLADSLGKNWNKTWTSIKVDVPEIRPRRLYEILDEVYGDILRTWRTAEKKTNSGKAFKRWENLSNDQNGE